MPEPTLRPTSSPEDDAARVVRRPRRQAGWSTGRRVAVGAASVVGGRGADRRCGAVWGLWSFASIDRVDLDLAQTEPTEPQNFLVVGSDSRAEISEDDPGAGGMLGHDAPTGQRADSLMIARVDPDSDRIDLLSMPRDLWVPIAGTGEEQRINTAYSQSAQAVVDTVQDALDIPIHHFVEVDFQGFSSLVDSLGGVPMYFADPVRDRNSGLYVLRVGLPGAQRHRGPGLRPGAPPRVQRRTASGVSDPTGDLGRMTRQQLLDAGRAGQGPDDGPGRRRSAEGPGRRRAGLGQPGQHPRCGRPDRPGWRVSRSSIPTACRPTACPWSRTAPTAARRSCCSTTRRPSPCSTSSGASPPRHR